MSKADRRRARAEHLATGGASTTPPPRLDSGEGPPPSPPPAPPRPRLSMRLPLLPVVVAAAAIVLLGTAWTTRAPPGLREAAPQENRFTVEIPADQQGRINSWERFFICYDLLDARIIDLTLRANQRATGTLDFPGPRVAVELPGADPDSQSPGGADEEELIRLRQTVMDAGAGRIADIRGQCGFPAPAPPPDAAPAGNEMQGNEAAPRAV